MREEINREEIWVKCIPSPENRERKALLTGEGRRRGHLPGARPPGEPVHHGTHPEAGVSWGQTTRSRVESLFAWWGEGIL